MPRMQLNFKGLIQLLARNLYPEPDVFLRELVQNGHDAIVFRRLDEPELAGRIDIVTDARARTITFIDNGIGMSRDDVVHFLSTIGTSGTGERARELLARGDKGAVLQTIGQFGIGFLSAFVVADTIEVVTRKRGSAQAFRWRSRGEEEYELEDAPGDVPVGTRATLFIAADKVHHLDGKLIGDTLKKYADFLPFPIFVDGNGPVNRMHAPWHLSGAVDVHELRKFVSERFPDHPIHVIPIRFEHPRAQGVLYISNMHVPGINTPGLVDIFQQRMCIRLNDQDLLPEWAKFVRGVIDSPDLTPTAARDNVQKDGAFHELRRQLGAAIIASLIELAEKDQPRFVRLCDWHHYHLKGMAVHHDDFFQAVIEHLPFETSAGPLNLRQCRGKQRTEPGAKVPLHYFSSARDSNQFYDLCSARGLVAINAGHSFEEELLRKYAAKHDRAVELRRLDTLHDEAIFRPLTEAEARAARPLEDAVRRALPRAGIPNVTPQARRFQPASLSSALIGAERSEALSKMEALLRDPTMREGFGELAEETIRKLEESPLTLYLNLENPLVKALLELPDIDPDRHFLLLVGVYNCAVLTSQTAMTPKNARIFHAQFQEHMTRTLELERELGAVQRELEKARLQLSEQMEVTGQGLEQDWVKVFVMLPFADRYRAVEAALREVLEAPPYCFEVVLARDKVLDGAVLENVRHHIRSANAFVADISEHSANVFLELGWPHFDTDFASRPRVLLRSRQGKERPEDLGGRVYVEYGSPEDADLTRQLAEQLGRDEGLQALRASRKARALTVRLLEANAAKIPVSPNAARALVSRWRTVEQLRGASQPEVAAVLGENERWLAAVVPQICESILGSSAAQGGP